MKPYPVSNILIGVSGSAGIVDLPLRLVWLQKVGVSTIDLVLSPTAKHMISIQSLIDLSLGHVWVQEDFDIQADNLQPWPLILSSGRDAILMMPATANLLGKAANGIADGILSTIVLAAECPVIFVPSMNEILWRKPSVQRNINTLREDGYIVLDMSMAKSLNTGQEVVGGMMNIVTVSTIMTSSVLSYAKRII